MEDVTIHRLHQRCHSYLTTHRNLGDDDRSGNDFDGTAAVMIMLIIVFCILWAPAQFRRCRSRNNAERNLSAGDRMAAFLQASSQASQAEMERIRRMMIMEGGGDVGAGGMTLEDRREYIANALMVKHIVKETDEEEKNNTNKELSKEKRKQVKERKGDVVLPGHSIVKDSDTVRDAEDNDSSDDEFRTCPICLTEYEDGDEISWSQNKRCNHFFHRDCISEWLLSHEECPCCRLDFLSFDDDETEEENGGGTDSRVTMATAPMWVDNSDRDTNDPLARGLRLFFRFASDPAAASRSVHHERSAHASSATTNVVRESTTSNNTETASTRREQNRRTGDQIGQFYVIDEVLDTEDGISLPEARVSQHDEGNRDNSDPTTEDT